MKKITPRLLLPLAGLLLVLLPGLGLAQGGPAQGGPQAGDPLPGDPALDLGRLDNGLTYYIRPNALPAKRAILSLVVDAGSLLEDEDQRGAAHFLEHMAFRGSRSFAEGRLAEFLRSIGREIGPDANAATGLEETVYSLEVPTDDPAVLDKALRALADWAYGIRLDAAAFERERGVVQAELRQSQGLGLRMMEEVFPLLFPQSRLLDRLPGGTGKSLEEMSLAGVERFYRDWYRPDLMAVVAVGDFDAPRVKKLVQSHFAGMTSPTAPRAKPDLAALEKPQPKVVAKQDADQTVLELSLLYPLDKAEAPESLGDYWQNVRESIFVDLLNIRLAVLVRQPGVAVMAAQMSVGGLTRDHRVLGIDAQVVSGRMSEGIEWLGQELERVRRHGFTPAELDRYGRDFELSLEQLAREEDKTVSGFLAQRFTGHFLVGAPCFPVGRALELNRHLLAERPLEALQEIGRQWLAAQPAVVLAGPQGVGWPNEAEVRAALGRAADAELAPLGSAEVGQGPIGKLPPPGDIVAERHIASLDYDEWTLANGARVVLKETDFQNDQILFAAISPGGLSLYPDGDVVAGALATQLVMGSGLGELDGPSLDKLLAGTGVGLSLQIDVTSEGIGGGANRDGLARLFELTHLAFTAPRLDLAVHQRMFEGMTEGLARKNRDQIFGELIQNTLHPNSARYGALTLDEAQGWKPQRSFEIYRERFADAGDFTFVLVGNLDLEQIRPLVRTYLANLPSQGKKESWQVLQDLPPRGVLSKVLRQGQENRADVLLVLTSPLEWSREQDFQLNVLTHLLDQRLNASLREKLGKTYQVGVAAKCFNAFCELADKGELELDIAFGCATDEVDELEAEILRQLALFGQEGPKPEELEFARQGSSNELQTMRKSNEYWLRTFAQAYLRELDPLLLDNHEKRLAALDGEKLRALAAQVLTGKNLAKFVLLPE